MLANEPEDLTCVTECGLTVTTVYDSLKWRVWVQLGMPIDLAKSMLGCECVDMKPRKRRIIRR